MPGPFTRLALFRLAGRLTAGPKATGSMERLLIIKPDHMGDVLLASPAIFHLRQHFPTAQITLAVGARGAEVARRLPGPDTVEVVPFPGLDPATQPDVLTRWALLLRQARRWYGQYDAAVLLRDDYFWGAMLMAAARIPGRVGTATPLCAPFLTDGSTPEVRLAAAQHMAVAALLTGEQAPSTWDPAYRLRFTAQGGPSAAQTRRGASGLLANEPYALLHPGAGAAVKLWTAEGWAAVILALHAASGLRTLVLAGSTEQHLIAPILRRAGSAAVALPFAPDLRQLTTLMQGAQLVLGVDSGPLHLAAALDVPSVRLYGPVDPRIYGPWADLRRHRWVASNLLCAPCGRLHWDELDLPWHPCVRRLSPEAVSAAALAALKSRPELQPSPPLEAALQVVPPGDSPLAQAPAEVDLPTFPE